MNFQERFLDPTQKPKASRASFGEALERLGAENGQIVVLDADLSKSTQTYKFAEKFPKRFFNMGIAEANMIGTAAGLSMSGYIPFAASFACFLTGRYDQIRMSVAASKANVRLIGTHAGVGIGEDGHSQMGLEDLTLMRSLPNMTVFQPGDDRDTQSFMEWSLQHQGPIYARLTRQNLPALKRSADWKLTPGAWTLLNPEDLESADVVLMATGSLLEATIAAAEDLSKKSVKAAVVNANWIKPYDELFLNKAAHLKSRLWVTCEDHYIVGGLGGLVAEHITSKGYAKRLLRIGVTEFGQSGSPEDNCKYYGFTGPQIAERVLKELG